MNSGAPEGSAVPTPQAVVITELAVVVPELQHHVRIGTFFDSI